MAGYLREVTRLGVCVLLLIALSACGGTAAPPTEVSNSAPTNTTTMLPAEQDELPTPSATAQQATMEVAPTPEPTTTEALTNEPSPTAKTGAEMYQSGTPSMSPAEAKAIIEEEATKAVTALKNKDMEYLATIAHPDSGVTFTPYIHFSDTDLTLTPDQLRNAFEDSTVRLWGSYDGTGDPINLTFAEYYDRFIYSQDFVSAPSITYNELVGFDTSINNIFEVYPKGIAVEYHFPGIDPQYDGMDWQSLYLVFQQREGSDTWHLVHIGHGQWTI